MIRSTQLGATMISLLVGMVVSMLAILASVSMFHDLVRTAAEAKTDARHEGDLSLAVLRLDQEILAAGFDMGRAPTDNKNLDFLAASEGTAAAPGTSRFAWRYNSDGNYVCKRAVARRLNESFFLELFEAKNGVCTKDFLLNKDALEKEDNWDATTVEELVRIQLLNLQGDIKFNAPLIQFESAGDDTCSPFGAAAEIKAPAKAPIHPTIKLKIYDPAAVYGFDGVAAPLARDHTICLINIVIQTP